MPNQIPNYPPPYIPYMELPHYAVWYNSNNNLTVSGKRMVLLSRASKYYILVLCRQCIKEDIPEIFQFFDSNENTAMKFYALEKRL